MRVHIWSSRLPLISEKITVAKVKRPFGYHRCINTYQPMWEVRLNTLNAR